jgi:ABC-type multidrug transport system ATPase subunit
MLFTAHHVSKHYRAGTPGCAATARVLSRISLDLDVGDAVGVAGPRGCGKTTLVRSVAGLARADAGALCWAPGAERAPIVALAPAALPFESVHDVLSRACADPLVDPELLADALNTLALDGLVANSQMALTTDERARLALAIGLATRHPLLLLDGTADAVAARARPTVRECVRRHAADGHAVLITGRDVEAVSSLVAVMFRLQDGRLLRMGDEERRGRQARVAERNAATTRRPPAVR